jgi:hypothetical protein
LWIFLYIHTKKSPINGLLGSLQGIKMHNGAFLFNFALKRNKLLGKIYMYSPVILEPKETLYQSGEEGK